MRCGHISTVTLILIHVFLLDSFEIHQAFTTIARTTPLKEARGEHKRPLKDAPTSSSGT